jgi:hypothetical protein
MIADLQALIVLALALGAFALEVFALVDALRRKSGAFVAAGKRTKRFWVILLVVAAALGFIGLPRPVGFGDALSIFSIIAVVAAAVYLTDVRPAVRQIRGGGGTNSGPYGPW